MKQVVDVNIAGSKFSIEEDAYLLLKDYLNKFELSITNKAEAKEIMEDVESRVSDIFQKEIKFENQTINTDIVKSMITCLGDIDVEEGQPETDSQTTGFSEQQTMSDSSVKKLYRSVDDSRIAGVCGGLAAYFNIDTSLIRIVFLAALLLAGSTFWIYLIIWIVAPKAVTVAQKLEMRGIPVTAENIKNFSNKQ